MLINIVVQHNSLCITTFGNSCPEYINTLDLFKTMVNLKAYITTLLLGVLYHSSFAQTWTHDFETLGGYTTSDPECTTNAYDYFIRTDGTNIGDVPTAGTQQGSFYFAAQDIDATTCPEIAGSTATLDFDDIDINGCSGLSFEVLLAEPSLYDGWDNGEYVHIYYDIDNSGTWSNLIWIENDGLGTNGPTLIDTDFNGIGDGTTLTFDMVNFSAPISGTGLVIDIRIEFKLINAGANICIDNLRIFGAGCGIAPPTITTGAITGAPFNVDCTASTIDNGSIAFTSTSTFNVGNIYTAELSDETGNFAAPTTIGTLTSTANSGNVNIAIPSGLNTSLGYLIRVVSDSPSTTGSNSSAFTITQDNPCLPSLPSSQGLLINEWSNGTTGSQEYYEFVVAGKCGDLVDIRGYILDDNNGTFSVSFPSTSGIAQGHLRLTNDAQWASIPVGSLIVIYNDDEATNSGFPADDINDSDNDSLYVIPHNNSSLFEITGSLPSNAAPDSTYSIVSYLSTSWTPLGLRNDGDAIQVRSPDGSYWHGVSYGGAEMTGGPDNMKISTSGMGSNCGWFTDGDFLDVSNWTTGSANTNETPGFENNILNLAWLRAMRDPLSPTCPFSVLPVEIINFAGENSNEGNVLYWNTASERNSDYFTIERSTNGKIWSEIGTVKSAGNSEIELTYKFIDYDFSSKINYYRLKQTDFDGITKKHYKIITIDNIELLDKNLIGIYNLLGQKIDANYIGMQLHIYDDGTSVKVFNQ